MQANALLLKLRELSDLQFLRPFDTGYSADEHEYQHICCKSDGWFWRCHCICFLLAWWCSMAHIANMFSVFFLLNHLHLLRFRTVVIFRIFRWYRNHYWNLLVTMITWHQGNYNELYSVIVFNTVSHLFIVSLVTCNSNPHKTIVHSISNCPTTISYQPDCYPKMWPNYASSLYSLPLNN